MIRRIAHLCIVARDLEETERFYCEALGMRKGFEFVKAGERIGFYVEAGPMNFIEVFRGEPGEGANRIRHFCLEVDHLENVVSRLKEHNVEVTGQTCGCDNTLQAWCKDPNGIDIEFQQYTGKSLQLRGGTAVVE
jgi:glyoxylase I family protein